MVECRKCGAAIYFNGKIKSRFGKLIPMSVSTRKKHSCSERRSRAADLSWLRQQRFRAEAKRRAEQERVRQIPIDKLQQQQREHDLGCEILGIPTDSTDEVKKMAYRDRMMQFHPDRYDGDKEVAHRMAVKINWAYEHSVNVMLNVKR